MFGMILGAFQIVLGLVLLVAGIASLEPFFIGAGVAAGLTLLCKGVDSLAQADLPRANEPAPPVPATTGRKRGNALLWVAVGLLLGLSLGDGE
jgi:hypothetical protein